MGHIYWGEHMFFEQTSVHSQEFEMEKVLIKVYDYNLIGYDALIGEFEVDLVSCYFAENRAVLHKWVALSNIQKDF